MDSGSDVTYSDACIRLYMTKKHFAQPERASH